MFPPRYAFSRLALIEEVSVKQYFDCAVSFSGNQHLQREPVCSRRLHFLYNQDTLEEEATGCPNKMTLQMAAAND